MNKTKLVVTRVFDSKCTPQDAFVRAILNSDKEEKCLRVSGNEDIIEPEELLCTKILVGAKHKVNGEKLQSIEIHYRFIGNLTDNGMEQVNKKSS